MRDVETFLMKTSFERWCFFFSGLLINSTEVTNSGEMTNSWDKGWKILVVVSHLASQRYVCIRL